MCAWGGVSGQTHVVSCTSHVISGASPTCDSGSCVFQGVLSVLYPTDTMSPVTAITPSQCPPAPTGDSFLIYCVPPSLPMGIVKGMLIVPMQTFGCMKSLLILYIQPGWYSIKQICQGIKCNFLTLLALL